MDWRGYEEGQVFASFEQFLGVFKSYKDVGVFKSYKFYGHFWNSRAFKKEQIYHYTCLYNKAPFNCKSELRIANYGGQSKYVITKYNSHHKGHKVSTKVYKQSPRKNKGLKLFS
jgi:hypothetical protein